MSLSFFQEENQGRQLHSQPCGGGSEGTGEAEHGGDEREEVSDEKVCAGHQEPCTLLTVKKEVYVTIYIPEFALACEYRIISCRDCSLLVNWGKIVYVIFGVVGFEPAVVGSQPRSKHQIRKPASFPCRLQRQ